jgi:hypothetical protein
VGDDPVRLRARIAAEAGWRHVGFCIWNFIEPFGTPLVYLLLRSLCRHKTVTPNPAGGGLALAAALEMACRNRVTVTTNSAGARLFLFRLSVC